MQSIKTMRSWYVEGFNEIASCELPESQEDEAKFFAVTDKIYNR